MYICVFRVYRYRLSPDFYGPVQLAFFVISEPQMVKRIFVFGIDYTCALEFFYGVVVLGQVVKKDPDIGMCVNVVRV